MMELQRLRVIWPWQDRDNGFAWIKAITFVLLFAPAIWLIEQVETQQFGPVPLGGMTYWSGLSATGLLLLALAVTPAMVLLRWKQLILVRRMIGVAALAYTVGHIIIYFALRFWNFASIAHEMVTRVSLILALVATAGLIALGATSLDAMVRRMGPPGWNRLHNTIYVITALALIHYLLSPDSYPEQYLTSGIFFWLLIWRWLSRRGLGTDIRALALLAVASCAFTVLLEAGWIWAYHDEEPVWTLRSNFSLDLGVSAGWKVLALGLLATIGAAIRRTPRVPADRMTARRVG